MIYSAHVFRQYRRGASLVVEADDAAHAAAEAYRREFPNGAARPLVRYDADRQAWYVEGVAMWISER